MRRDRALLEDPQPRGDPGADGIDKRAVQIEDQGRRGRSVFDHDIDPVCQLATGIAGCSCSQSSTSRACSLGGKIGKKTCSMRWP